MLDKLEKLEKEFLEIQNRLADPIVIANQNEYKTLSRRYKTLQTSADLAKKYRDTMAAYNEAKQILHDDQDPEMRELAENQLEEAEAEMKKLDEQAIKELLPKDPNDQKDCIIEIRAGAGGDEAGIFASELARMYFRFSERVGFKVELMEKSEGSPGCIKEVIFALLGHNFQKFIMMKS